MGAEGWPRTLSLRLRSLLRRDAVDRELDEELRYHVERQVEENMANGMTPEEARESALRAMGGVDRQKEACRDARRVNLLEEFAQDVRYGFRGLLRSPGFAIVAVLTLGIGIGANAAVFSVVNQVFLKPLPFREPDRLVAVWEEASFVGFPRNSVSPGNFLDWRANTQSFEDMAAFRRLDLSLTGDGEPERVQTLAATANVLPLLGVTPALGRNFLPEEDQPGGPNAILISDGLWRRRYAGAPDVVGREIFLDGQRCTIVGVMAPGFQLLDSPADMWTPMQFGPADAERRGAHYLDVLARLKPGVSVEQAHAEMQATMRRIASEYPDAVDPRSGALVLGLREALAGDARMPLGVLVVAVALVLLIACINVGNLLVSRGAGRGREIAVRAALGASGGRMVRQMLAENIPLVALGTAVGLVLAFWSTSFLRQLVPLGMRPSAELGLDPRVFAFTLLIAVTATVLFGLFPAFQAVRVNLNEALRRGSARAGFSAGGRLQSALVIGEVCLAIALLVGASLLVQTFLQIRGLYADLDAESVLTLKTVLPRSVYDTHAKRLAFSDRVLEGVRSLPGVTAAGYTSALALDYKGDSTTFTPEGRPIDPTLGYDAAVRLLNGDFMKAFGVSMRSGRYLDETDGPDSLPVVVVNETMARKFWPGEDAVGKRMKIGGPQSEAPWVTIVGVAADVRQYGAEKPTKPEMSFPYRQCDYLSWAAPRSLVIRTATGDQGPLVVAARRAIAAVDPNQPVSDVKTLGDLVGEDTSGRRLSATLLGAFAAIALLLASIGIYGLLSQRVAQMTPEIGVRMALGARPGDVVGLVVWRGMKLVLIGSVVGLALAFALARLMGSLLFGVSPGDALTFAGVPLVLVAVALVAVYLPARRAASVDPNVALKYE